ncbi:MAG: cytochrome P450 [Pseudomonadota bacterium]
MSDPADNAERPWEGDLSSLDLSRPRLFSKDEWRPYFKRFREEDPVYFHEDSYFGPYWSITKFDDIVAIDRNHQQFSSASGITVVDTEAGLPVKSFITSDQPDHGPARKAVQPVVAPKNLQQLESLIRSRASEILDSLPVGEPFNWVDAVSINLTTQMLATLFDFPFEERAKLTAWSDNFTNGAPRHDKEAQAASRQMAMDCMAYFQELWHRRQAEPTGGFDLITLMQQDPHTANMIDNPMEYLGNIGLLIVGGNDTTRNSITGGVLALNQNPDQYDKLRANPGLIASMVPEIIRWQTPLTHMRRTALEDVEFCGKTIRKGDKVVMWYVSGNRDDTVIDQADKFIIDRQNPRHHVSFGFGIHRCMGNRLAEMQLRVLWEEIVQRFDKVEVVGPVARVHSNFVRGYAELPVVVHPH